MNKNHSNPQELSKLKEKSIPNLKFKRNIFDFQDYIRALKYVSCIRFFLLKYENVLKWDNFCQWQRTKIFFSGNLVNMSGYVENSFDMI